jgi:hypothetical protein
VVGRLGVQERSHGWAIWVDASLVIPARATRVAEIILAKDIRGVFVSGEQPRLPWLEPVDRLCLAKLVQGRIWVEPELR